MPCRRVCSARRWRRARHDNAMPGVTTIFEPTADDVGKLVEELERSWGATITVRRKSREDVGYRDIHVDLDGEQIAILHAGDEVTRDVKAGPHRLKAHNTLFRKTLDVTLAPGEPHSVSAAMSR